ncbi:hypothetical protein RhiirB3_386285 [Rhizophagus irregularis]|nr:hypothetical protein RhiirB3_386285 [Rhizophagus irregularis]
MNSSENYTSGSSLFTSKLHQFDNLPEPRNATEAFHSKSLDFNIPDNIDDFDKVNNQKNSTSKLSSIFKDIQNDYKEETMQHKVKKNDNNFDGDIISSDNILATFREDLENKNNKRVKKEGYFESL